LIWVRAHFHRKKTRENAIFLPFFAKKGPKNRQNLAFFLACQPTEKISK